MPSATRMTRCWSSLVGTLHLQVSWGSPLGPHAVGPQTVPARTEVAALAPGTPKQPTPPPLPAGSARCSLPGTVPSVWTHSVPQSNGMTRREQRGQPTPCGRPSVAEGPGVPSQTLQEPKEARSLRSHRELTLHGHTLQQLGWVEEPTSQKGHGAGCPCTGRGVMARNSHVVCPHPWLPDVSGSKPALSSSPSSRSPQR